MIDGLQVIVDDTELIHEMWSRYSAVEIEEEGPIAYFASFLVHGQRSPVCQGEED